MDPTMPELSATLPVFDHNLSIVHYVNMPTLLLCENTGTREYVASLNRPRSMQRSRYVARRLHYFFCPDFFENDGAEGSCPHGQQCQDVHIIPAWVLSSQEIHVNTPQRSNIHNRARLSPGEQICVHKMDAKMQNGVWYNSDQILVTKGSADVAGGNSGTRRVFHCKHFYNNKMCTRGLNCVFIHVLDMSPSLSMNASNEFIPTMLPLTQSLHSKPISMFPHYTPILVGHGPSDFYSPSTHPALQHPSTYVSTHHATPMGLKSLTPVSTTSNIPFPSRSETSQSAYHRTTAPGMMVLVLPSRASVDAHTYDTNVSQ